MFYENQIGPRLRGFRLSQEIDMDYVIQQEEKERQKVEDREDFACEIIDEAEEDENLMVDDSDLLNSSMSSSSG